MDGYIGDFFLKKEFKIQWYRILMTLKAINDTTLNTKSRTALKAKMRAALTPKVGPRHGNPTGKTRQLP